MTENVHLSNMEDYDNPKNESLELVDITVNDAEGYSKVVKALSKHFVEKRYVLRYMKPDIYHEDGTEIVGAKDTWLEVVNFIIDDYSWLLTLPFHVFWSNIVFWPQYVDSLNSVLEKSPRFHEMQDFPNDEKMKERLYTLHKKSINICARIVTRKMSSTHFISKEYHGYLLYEYYLMTVPIMMHLCQLFGRENERVIHRIIKSTLGYQPRYIDDVKGIIHMTCEILGTIEDKLYNRQDNEVTEPGVLCISKTDEDKTKKILSREDVEDMVVYLMDFASSIEIFVTVYPPMAEYFSIDYFLIKIMFVYDNMIPELYKKVSKFINKEKHRLKYEEMMDYLRIARIGLIKIFRSITFRGIAIILEQPDIKEAENVKERVDEFLNYLTSAVSEKHLLIDYNNKFPIADDLELLHQITSDVDPVKESFLKRLVTEVISNYSQENKTRPNEANNLPSSLLNPVAGPSNAQNFVSLPENSASVGEVELKSLISNVKDVMYDLGEGFIQKCLEYYNSNAEAVINAILENSLPPDLKKLDRQMPYISSLSAMPSTSKAADQIETANISNLASSDSKMGIENTGIVEAHRGKRKSKYKNINEMLNDKSFKNQVASTYAKYSVVDEYDDEYDDTYECQNDGVILLNDDVEIDFRRFTTPRVLREAQPDDEEEQEEEVEEERELSTPSSSHPGSSSDRFIEDPAVLRARAEQRRQSRQQRDGKGGNKKFGDVIGKPKGQGNEKEVVINRDKKNTQKSSRANHNRRSGAEWKRRQGMVPS